MVSFRQQNDRLGHKRGSCFEKKHKYSTKDLSLIVSILTHHVLNIKNVIFNYCFSEGQQSTTSLQPPPLSTTRGHRLRVHRVMYIQYTYDLYNNKLCFHHSLFICVLFLHTEMAQGKVTKKNNVKTPQKCFYASGRFEKLMRG